MGIERIWSAKRREVQVQGDHTQATNCLSSVVSCRAVPAMQGVQSNCGILFSVTRFAKQSRRCVRAQ